MQIARGEISIRRMEEGGEILEQVPQEGCRRPKPGISKAAVQG